ncbi:MAG: RNA-binding S4 domain-containing protein [Tissierellia bacterium]|nr:RNA-binding S4 domain-containing protein [Tissierellia bacterium]
MRIDKFLKNARIIKRRTVAKEACEAGRVEINGRIAKPGDKVQLGDLIKIRFGSGDMTIKVLMIKDSVRKKDAEKMYETVN